MQVFRSKSQRYILTLEYVPFYKHATNSSEKGKTEEKKLEDAEKSFVGVSLVEEGSVFCLV